MFAAIQRMRYSLEEEEYEEPLERARLFKLFIYLVFTYGSDCSTTDKIFGTFLLIKLSVNDDCQF